MGNPATLKTAPPWPKGTSGNPGGKAKGARNRIQGAFLNALADHFEEHGKRAIARACEDDPMGYVKAVASLMPKQFEESQPLDELSDAELTAGIALLRARLTGSASEGANPPLEPESLN